MNQQIKSKDVAPSSSSRSNPVLLEYTINDNIQPIKKECELLVIACDPRNLYNICDYTTEELAIFNKLKNFTFHTSLLKVQINNPPSQPVTYPGIFAPKVLEQMDGSVYAYRNESAKQFGSKLANEMAYNLVTVYQLQGEAETALSPSEFEKILKQQLTDSNWWPFSTEYEVLKTFTTPYFDHFSNEGLFEEKLPWKILNLQGKNKTLYVHGFTCFESVLHCWDYAELVLNFVGSAEKPLPIELNAPIVILGAGVSGLLFATRLKRLGYTNIEILESTDRYCGKSGKTYTITKNEPYPPKSPEDTVCELGTCYLSPAYDHLIEDLKEFFVDNARINFGEGEPNFRGIVIKGEFEEPYIPENAIISQQEYILLKAKALLNLDPDVAPEVVMSKIALALAKYSVLHWKIMGSQTPMPLNPPEELRNKTFYEFLDENGLLSLVGMMQYIYSVQGYGVMTNIPAYYGLTWITPIVIQTILLDNFDPEEIPVVTALEKGWAALWDQIVTQGELNITYLAKATSIRR
ncbi:NAD(P)-binding protein [Calothrix sp. CCY 0018]|uniref:NAD(P)-binding protein n=1 Tax=Calothrix sp. CCY 0018 TaxID=3103864 RepID=UPI0039C68DE8